MRSSETLVGQPVRSLQTMLRVLAEDEKGLLSVIPDGIYGDQTRNAVYQFQRSRGLPATGVTDQATWDRIVSEYPAALTRISPAEPLELVLEPGQVIRRGEANLALYVVQAVLLTLGTVYGSILPPAVTGVLDEATSDAIASFQYLAALPQTGELDKVTWKHLALHYPSACNFRNARRTVRAAGEVS